MTQKETIPQNTARAQRTVLLVVVVTNFLNPFAGTALNVAVPFIGEEFHMSATELTWILSAYMMATVALSVPFGRIADIRGKRTMLILGIFLFAATAWLVTLAHGMPLFNVFRVAMGAGAAMIFATSVPILLQAFPPAMRGRVIGVYVAAVYVGLASGPVAGGLLTHYFGWRSVQIAIALISFAAFAVAFLMLPKDAGNARAPMLDMGADQPSQADAVPGDGEENQPEAPLRGAGERRPDGLSEGRATGDGAGNPVGVSPASVALYVASMLMFLYGLTTFGQNTRSYVILAAGAVAMAVYLRHEARSKAPMLEVRVFRHNAPFLLANLAALFNYAATFAVGYIFAIYLQAVKGYSADIAGIILISQPLVMTVVSPISGRLSDRKPPHMLASLGMAVCAASLLSFIFVDADTPLWRIVTGLVVCGFGFGLFSSPNTNAIMSSVEPRDFGVASSVQSTARTMGQVIGMAIITIVTNFVIGDMKLADVPAHSFAQNMHVSFTVFASLCVAGVFISLKRK